MHHISLLLLPVLLVVSIIASQSSHAAALTITPWDSVGTLHRNQVARICVRSDSAFRPCYKRWNRLPNSDWETTYDKYYFKCDVADELVILYQCGGPSYRNDGDDCMSNCVVRETYRVGQMRFAHEHTNFNHTWTGALHSVSFFQSMKWYESYDYSCRKDAENSGEHDTQDHQPASNSVCHATDINKTVGVASAFESRIYNCDSETKPSERIFADKTCSSLARSQEHDNDECALPPSSYTKGEQNDPVQWKCHEATTTSHLVVVFNFTFIGAAGGLESVCVVLFSCSLMLMFVVL